MRHLFRLCVAGALVLASGARADVFVITSTKDDKEIAQKEAAENGGWVLDTNLYAPLTPNKYAVVRGPFGRLEDAQKELKFLQGAGGYPGAYVKDVGKIRIGALLGGKSNAALAAALLGELQATVTEEPGGKGPCEPQEPYLAVELSFMTLVRKPDGNGEAKRQSVDVRTFSIIKRTGEVSRMRVCWE